MRLNEQQFNEAIQYLKESKNTLKLYHLSKDRNLSKMTPRIPKSKYEEQKTPRICFSTSIDGCLIGINENKNIEGEIFHVYSITTSDYYKPNTTEVTDVHITNEVWVTKPIEVRYEYSIKITGKKGTRKEKINENTFEVPEWKYEKVDNLREAIQYLEEALRQNCFGYVFDKEKDLGSNGSICQFFDNKELLKKEIEKITNTTIQFISADEAKKEKHCIALSFIFSKKGNCIGFHFCKKDFDYWTSKGGINKNIITVDNENIYSDWNKIPEFKDAGTYKDIYFIKRKDN